MKKEVVPNESKDKIYSSAAGPLALFIRKSTTLARLQLAPHDVSSPNTKPITNRSTTKVQAQTTQQAAHRPRTEANAHNAYDELTPIHPPPSLLPPSLPLRVRPSNACARSISTVHRHEGWASRPADALIRLRGGKSDAGGREGMVVARRNDRLMLCTVACRQSPKVLSWHKRTEGRKGEGRDENQQEEDGQDCL